jgi:hypothetical protein
MSSQAMELLSALVFGMWYASQANNIAVTLKKIFKVPGGIPERDEYSFDRRAPSPPDAAQYEMPHRMDASLQGREIW